MLRRNRARRRKRARPPLVARKATFTRVCGNAVFSTLKYEVELLFYLFFFYFVSFVFDSFFLHIEFFSFNFPHLTFISFIPSLIFLRMLMLPTSKTKTLMANRLKLIFSWTEILLRNRFALVLCYAMQRNITAVLDEFNLLSKKISTTQQLTQMIPS